MVDRWPRAAAGLIRQAIENSLIVYWASFEPSMIEASMRAQLLAVRVDFPDEELAESVSAAWASLSRACHYHPYELAPTAEELQANAETAQRFAAKVDRLVAQADQPKRPG